MAEYHKFLKYHDDTTEKHDITNDELDFLIKLQKEMNTQDTVSQADPRFWVIKGTEKLYHVEEADGYELYDSDCCKTIADTTEKICDYINDNLLEDINCNRLDGEEFKVEFENGLLGERIIVNWLDGGCQENDMSEELSDLHDIKNWLEEQGYGEYEVISYKTVDKIYENTMFLTQSDAENHLQLNHYHYSADAHTYAMTSWRSSETEMLWKILRQVDWEEVLKKRGI